MDFTTVMEGQLVGIRPQTMTDRDTGEEVRYFEVDLIVKDEQGNRAEKLTCGEKAFNGHDYTMFKGGQKVTIECRPKRVGKFGIGAKLTRIDPR